MFNDILRSLGKKVLSYSDALNSFNRAVIFGAGGSGEHAYHYLRDRGKEVLFFCDNNNSKHGTFVESIQILSPEILRKQKDHAVIIASGWAKEIALQLKSLGVSQYYDFTDIVYMYQPTKNSEGLWEKHFNPIIFQDHAAEIDRIYDGFKDEGSQCAFLGVVKYRMTMDPSYLCIAEYQQYYHPIVKPSANHVIVDAGAWKGDISISFAKHLHKQCKIYSFEPSERNIIDLKNEILKEQMEGVIVPVPMGVWEKDEKYKLNITADYDQGYYLDKDGEESILLTSLDSFSQKNNLSYDFIKMDIEGAETSALKGAEKSLKKFHPALQICVYHKPEDLWEIPSIIERYYDKCEFYFGHHGQHLHESVLYVNPSSV